MGKITDYSSLQSAIADYLNRGDLTSQIQMFIQFCESNINANLRAREMIVRAQATSDKEYVKLPYDWLEASNMQIIGGTSPLRYITLDSSDILKNDTSLHEVAAYSIMDDAIELVPAPTTDVDIEMVYYAKVRELTDTEPSNWLLDKAPEVYLYGSLMHAATFLVDDTRVPTFASFYTNMISKLNEESYTALHSGSPLVARSRSRF